LRDRVQRFGFLVSGMSATGRKEEGVENSGLIPAFAAGAGDLEATPKWIKSRPQARAPSSGLKKGPCVLSLSIIHTFRVACRAAGGGRRAAT